MRRRCRRGAARYEDGVPALRMIGIPLLVVVLACSGEEAAPGGHEGPPVARAAGAGPPAPAKRSRGKAPLHPPAAGIRGEDPPAEPARVHAASELRAPRELTVGQWVRYRILWREGGESSLGYAVVGAEDGAYWMEVDDRRRGARKVFRMLVELGDRTDPATLSVRQLITHDGRDRREVPERLLETFQPVLRQLLNVMFSDWEGREPETVSVPAGTFEGALHGVQQLELQGTRMTADVWHHADVPVTGMVRFRAQGEQRHQLELIAYGDSGARSLLEPSR